MIVDSSAVMALVLGEPEQIAFNRLLTNAHHCQISAGNWVELAAVITRRAEPLGTAIDLVMSHYQIAIAPVTADQARIGHAAYCQYGRGTGHIANLNFGDCFSYALARATGEPLLFKGDDFVHTDVAVAA